MSGTKKIYVSPSVESERLELPEAWACDIFDANASHWYYGEKYGYQEPTVTC